MSASRTCVECGDEFLPGKKEGRSVRCAPCRRSEFPCIRCGERWKRPAGGRGRSKRLCGTCSVDWDICCTCHKILSLEAFPPNNSRKTGHQPNCYPCYKRAMHSAGIKRRFNIDREIYDAILELQDGRCAICLSQPRTRMLAVDHHHKTGLIRGLLCTRCNHKLLGSANENPEILRRAADYLEFPPLLAGVSAGTVAVNMEWLERWQKGTDKKVKP